MKELLSGVTFLCVVIIQYLSFLWGRLWCVWLPFAFLFVWGNDGGEQLDDQAFLWAHEHVGEDAADFATGEAGGYAS